MLEWEVVFYTDKQACSCSASLELVLRQYELVLSRLAAAEAQTKLLLQSNAHQTVQLNTLLQQRSEGDEWPVLPDGVVLPLVTIDDIHVLEGKLKNLEVTKQLVCSIKLLILLIIETRKN